MHGSKRVQMITYSMEETSMLQASLWGKPYFPVLIAGILSIFMWSLAASCSGLYTALYNSASSLDPPTTTKGPQLSDSVLTRSLYYTNLSRETNF